MNNKIKTEQKIKQVMEKYGKAWETQDTEPLLSCFTNNGIYQESPLSNPYRGHKEIESFWNKVVVKETNNIKFKLGKCYIFNDGKIGFADWKCKNIQRWKNGYMVEIMLLKMRENNINYLNEYWNNWVIK